MAINISAQPECRTIVTADKGAVTNRQAVSRLPSTGKSAAAVISAGKSPAVDDQVAFIKIYGVPAAVTVVPAFKAAAVDGRRAALYQNSFG